MDRLSPLALFGVLVLVAAALWSSCQEIRLEGALARETARADSLAAALAAERIRADGWEVAFGQVTTSLLEELAAADSQAARLARELEAARMRPASRTAIVASAGGEVDVPAREVPGREGPAGAPPDLPGPVAGDVVDGPLEARILYLPLEERFRLAWNVRVPAELVHAWTVDGRLLVTARSSDPRVSLEVAALEYEITRADRRVVSWRWILAAAAAGAIGWELIR